MDAARFDRRIAAIVPVARVERHAPLALLTTFRVGGPADWLITVESLEELLGLLGAAAASEVPISWLGGGSNVVVSDDGVRGAVVRARLMAISRPAADRVRAEAGVTVNGLVRWTVGRGLAGLEAWAGTPGTVGGAVCGNAHWEGRNIGELVAGVGLATPDGRVLSVPPGEMGFAYDTSRLRRTREVLIWADFRVRPADPDALRRTARASLAYRKRTQPLARPSAGCVFQNPDPAREAVPPGVPPSAGALIDRAGLKGYRIGGASISETHANFVVNDGTATARDVRRLVETARAAVRERFGVELRDEVVFLGAF